MGSIFIDYFQYPYAEFILGVYQDQLCLCDYRFRRQRSRVDGRLQRGLQAQYVAQSHPLLEQAKGQLDEYFLGQRRIFTLPLLAVGTPFQRQVWQQLQQIEYGQTCSYRELARQIGQPRAVRAVANANGANALALVIPCHRVIGSDGRLSGYAGGVALKQRLLNLEGGLF